MEEIDKEFIEAKKKYKEANRMYDIVRDKLDGAEKELFEARKRYFKANTIKAKKLIKNRSKLKIKVWK